MPSTDNSKATIAVLGAGIMGGAMALNLLRAGYAVRAWSRSEGRLDSLVAQGAVSPRHPDETVEGAKYVITSLPDGAATRYVMEGPHGALGGLPRGALWMQMSTVGLDDTEHFFNRADYHGVEFIDAPVLGSRQPAERGELTILASGPPSLAERAQPVFDILGRKTFWLGPVGAGTRFKLAFNSWITNTVAALAETISLAEALEVDAEDFFAVLADSPLNMPYAHVKGRAMLQESFEASFPLRLAAKDARLMLDAAAEHDLKLPVTEAAARQYLRAAELGHGDDDLAAVLYAVREPSGARGGHGPV